MWSFEIEAVKNGCKYIAGVDEAGRGPLAGPVVSAAVILPLDFPDHGITDSKKLSPKKRDQLFYVIMENALAVSTGTASSLEIDEINILQASLKSMERAVSGLDITPDYLLIDGKFLIDSNISQQAIIKGDSKSISVAAASIIAKVTRDSIMEKLHEKYPVYGFNRHKGYPTKAHKESILKYGSCFEHRQSFKGVKGL
ncbi:MAG: ribonuclease HII [Thermodesulfobacteriota bacterium]|nr:ribonuclease HII [Thermodesulfobacteriota bacterium]